MLAGIHRGASRLRHLLARSPGFLPANDGCQAIGRSTLSSMGSAMEGGARLGSQGGLSGARPSAPNVSAVLSRGLWATFVGSQRRRSQWQKALGSRGVSAAAAQPLPLPSSQGGGTLHPGERQRTDVLAFHPTTSPAPALQQQPSRPPNPWIPPGPTRGSWSTVPVGGANGTSPVPGQNSRFPSNGTSGSHYAAPSARAASAFQPATVGAAPVPAPAPAAAAAAGPLAAASPSLCWLEGTVQKVQYRCANTAYSVLRVQVSTTPELEAAAAAAGAGALFTPKARPGARRGAGAGAASSGSGRAGAAYRPRKATIAVVGNLPSVTVGQCLRIAGGWGEHRQYGWQFKATDIQELSPQSNSDLVAYLAGGVIPGVGPITAQCMVDKWGSEIERVLDSPSAMDYLRQCNGIGAKTAERIKAGWDMNRGTREGVMFLKEHGVPVPLAQRVADRWGAGTRGLVERDPYAALSGLGLAFNKVDQLAARIGATPDLVSRAGLALSEALGAAAAEEGHAYLPWEVLEPRALRLLCDAGEHHGHPWPHPDSLQLVAQHMHATGGSLVAEPPLFTSSFASEAPHHEAVQPAAETLGDTARERPQPLPALGRAHPELRDEEELKAYLRGRISGLSEALVQAMWDAHGPAILAVLDSTPAEACRQLQRCRKVGPKSAEKFKSRWDASFGVGSAGSGGGGPLGLRLADVLAAPPTVAFAWGPGTRCYTPTLHQAEQTVAKVALQKAGLYKRPSEAGLRRIRAWIAQNQKDSDLELSEGQRAAIEVASDAPIMVLTGGPGCGKTSTVQTIVKLWGAQGKLVRICAPTGRAAQRMGMIQGIEPCTIHRLLRYQPRRTPDGSPGGAAAGAGEEAASEEAALGEGGAFEYGPDNPLPAWAVLVDEASMLSLPLAAALLGALRPRCQLVLVGDVDQLPPVGPGSVLHSLIQSGLVPVVDLREIFRQAAESCIVTSAVAVRRGEAPALHPVRPTPEELDSALSDALWVEAASSEDVPETVKQTVQALVASSRFAGPEHLQVITPMRKGHAGTTHLNPLLQQLLNPPHRARPEVPRHAGGGAGAGGAGSVFRLGDRVIQLINNYDKDIFNGDQGMIVGAVPADRKLVVRFPKAPTADNPEPHIDVPYQGQELSQLELAYAITVHKAQGGEARHVVLALSQQHGRMLTRRLLYTGLTRAKEQLIVVAPGGPHSPVSWAVHRAEHGTRLSSLEERLAAGGAARALGRHEPRVFSNESEVLHLHQSELAEGDSMLHDQHKGGHGSPRADSHHERQGQQQPWRRQGQEEEGNVGASMGGPRRTRSGRTASPRQATAAAAVGEAVAGTAKPSGRAGKNTVEGILEGLSPAAAKNAAYLLEEQLLPLEAVRSVKQLLEEHQHVDLRATLPGTLSLLRSALGPGASAGAGAEEGSPELASVSARQLVAHAPLVLVSSPDEVRKRLQFLEWLPGGGSRVVQQARDQLSQEARLHGGWSGEHDAAALGVVDGEDGRAALGSGGLEHDGEGSMLDQLARIKAILETMREQHAARQRVS